MTHNYRHGDVLLVSASPSELGAPTASKILAKGEATGHHHSFATNTAQIYATDTTRYLVVSEPTTIEHQEHKPITVPTGTYEIRIQRELDLMGEIRQVLD
jgi:hypothetical protein